MILSNDYPSIEDDYALYLKRQKRNKRFGIDDEGFCLNAFYGTLGADDFWTLKFVDGTLVPKSIYSEDIRSVVQMTQ